MQERKIKLLIIGSGPAGYTAAIYAARANLEPVLVTGLEQGGQLMITTDVENYPGFAEVIQGPWLMEQMQKQALHVGTEVVNDRLMRVDFSQRPFICEAESGLRFLSDSVIICTGAQAKWLGLESEKKFMGMGVSGCATCDGFFYKNKDVAVIGGGNTAVEEALFLTHHARHVTLIHRRERLRADPVLQDRLFKNPKITVIWDHVLEEVLGQETPQKRVTGVRLKHATLPQVQEIPIEGVFIAIGHSPTTHMFKDQLEMDPEGYLISAPGGTATSVEGVFAAGDVQDKKYRQAITAAGLGCMAALDAARYLSEKSTSMPC